MKRVIKRAVSFVLVFMTVFSVFTILPSEVFHTAYVKAAEMFSSETGASAQETYTTDDFTYTLIDEYSKVQILSYIGSDTDVVIPDRIDNKKVTSIADSAFREKSITSVVFGQYVESIGNYAFYSCQSLNKLDFSKSSVKTIGSYAFTLCKSLESIEFPDSLESIGYGAFSAYTYGDRGSYEASSLKSVKFGSGLKSIANDAFYGNRALNTVNFTGVALTSIGYQSFYNTAITELDLSGTDASIGTCAFYNCNSLETVKLSGVKTIGQNAFYNCRKLTSVELSENLTSIESGAFQSCVALKNIDIPNKVTKLNDNTFANCTSLKNVSIGSGCTSISSTAFLNANVIEKITVAGDNANYSSVDGALLNKEKTSIVLYPKSKSGEFAVPDTVTSIANYAFDNSPNITKVTIGENVKSIGTGAFRNCKSLETVVFEDSDTVQKAIGAYAFNNCPALTEVNFGNAVKSIGDEAFTACKSLESLEFPDSLESIGEGAFSRLSNGTSGSYIESILKRVKFGSGLETIGDYAFYGHGMLKTIEFTGDNLKSIGSKAFYNCFAITELNITGNGLVIDSYAFYCIYALKSVTLGTGVKTINSYAFQQSAFETVNIGNDVETIGRYAFYNNNKLKQLVLGKV